MTLKHLLLAAFRKAGIEPRKLGEPSRSGGTQQQHNSGGNKPSDNERGSPNTGGLSNNVHKPPEQIGGVSKKNQTAPANIGAVSLPGMKASKISSTVKPGVTAKAAQRRESTEAPFNEQFTLRIGDKTRGLLEAKNNTVRLDLLPYWNSPVPRHTSEEEHELRLGLDFGTSTVKVIIGDKNQQKAFAVPFFDVTDSNRYLLPTRLFLDRGKGSLERGDECYSDMKMQLLESIDDTENQIRTTLFLALVLRHAINWLLHEHAEVYGKGGIFWRLAIGLPSTHLGKQEATYRNFVQAAWLLALSTDHLTLERATAEFTNVSEKLASDPDCNVIGIDYSIVPELAAQIFGYVSSDGFDPYGQKAFLLVDVGAGTLDAAVFRASKNKGKTDYDFYSATVQPNGVNMLHRHRLFWWRNALLSLQPSRPELSALANEAITTQEVPARIPDSIEEYFTKTELSFNTPQYNPDHGFLHAVRHQVVTECLIQAQKDGHWATHELLDIPFYLCGGGSRVKLYRQLQTELAERHPNISWLKASPRPLVIPSNLVADYLAKEDYDRLTVAYGLSFDDVGRTLKHTPNGNPTATNNQHVHRPWWDNYIEN